MGQLWWNQPDAAELLWQPATERGSVSRDFDIPTGVNTATASWQAASDGSLVYSGNVYIDRIARAGSMAAGCSLGLRTVRGATWDVSTAGELASQTRVWIQGNLYLREGASLPAALSGYTAGGTVPIVFGGCNIAPGSIGAEDLSVALWSNLNAQEQQGLAGLSNVIAVEYKNDLSAASASLTSSYIAADNALSNVIAIEYKNDLAAATSSLTSSYIAADNVLSNVIAVEYKNDLLAASANLTTGYQNADQTLSNYFHT